MIVAAAADATSFFEGLLPGAKDESALLGLRPRFFGSAFDELLGVDSTTMVDSTDSGVGTIYSVSLAVFLVYLGMVYGSRLV